MLRHEPIRRRGQARDLECMGRLEPRERFLVLRHHLGERRAEPLDFLLEIAVAPLEVVDLAALRVGQIPKLSLFRLAHGLPQPTSDRHDIWPVAGDIVTSADMATTAVAVKSDGSTVEGSTMSFSIQTVRFFTATVSESS